MAHCHAAKASTSWMRARRIEGSLRHRLLLAGLAGFLPTKNSPAPPILFARVNLTRGETLPLLWQSPALVCASSFTFTGSVLPLLQVEGLLLTRRSGVCCTSCRVEHFQKACDIPTSALREGAGYLGLMPSLAVPAPSTLPRSTSSRLVALFCVFLFLSHDAASTTTDRTLWPLRVHWASTTHGREGGWPSWTLCIPVSVSPQPWAVLGRGPGSLDDCRWHGWHGVWRHCTLGIIIMDAVRTAQPNVLSLF